METGNGREKRCFRMQNFPQTLRQQKTPLAVTTATPPPLSSERRERERLPLAALAPPPTAHAERHLVDTTFHSRRTSPTRHLTRPRRLQIPPATLRRSPNPPNPSPLGGGGARGGGRAWRRQRGSGAASSLAGF
ncbi:hypothetical protein PVAP13_4KG075733 [Panicum virgatum]|uniref:Uncharacterized protein n=1 Tax=Panicum virgatum TaxID=38727 RepID=A0A8T0TDN0_PANVG|nr:hypothetical protein PVAP13_4KG075733 [Panicum virgatum]